MWCLIIHGFLFLPRVKFMTSNRSKKLVYMYIRKCNLYFLFLTADIIGNMQIKYLSYSYQYVRQLQQLTRCAMTAIHFWM